MPMHNVDKEAKAAGYGCQVMLVAVDIFLGCGVWSWGELRYAVWGHTAVATITDAQVVTHRGRRGRKWETLDVSWSYPLGEGTASGMQSLDTDHRLPTDRQLRIVWLAGDPPSSRIKGTGTIIPIVVFLSSLAALAWAAWRAWKQADEDVARSKRG